MNDSGDASATRAPAAGTAQPITNVAAVSLIQNGDAVTPGSAPSGTDQSGDSASNTPDPSLNLMAMLQAAQQGSQKPAANPAPPTGDATTDTQAAVPQPDAQDGTATAGSTTLVRTAGHLAATDSDTGTDQTTGASSSDDNSSAAANTQDPTQAATVPPDAAQIAAAAIPAATAQSSSSGPTPEQIAALNAAQGVTQKPADAAAPAKPNAPAAKLRADATKTAAKPGDGEKTGEAPASDKLAAKTDDTAPSVQPAHTPLDAARPDTAKSDLASQNTKAMSDAIAAPAQAAAPPMQEPKTITADVQVSAQRHDSDAPTALDKLGVSIAAKAMEGLHEFDIRLDPPDLGRMQVKLTVDDAGQAQAALVVDKPQTLDLLQRDAASLNRALTDAGLNLTGNGLSFSLREQQQQQSGGNTPKGRSRTLSATAALSISPARAAGSYAPNSVRLDIRV